MRTLLLSLKPLKLSRIQCFDFQRISKKQNADLIEPLMVWLLRRIDDVLFDPANLGGPVGSCGQNRLGLDPDHPGSGDRRCGRLLDHSLLSPGRVGACFLKKEKAREQPRAFLVPGTGIILRNTSTASRRSSLVFAYRRA